MKKYFSAALDFVTSENFYLYLLIIAALVTNFCLQDTSVRAEVFGKQGFLIAVYCVFRVIRLEKQVKELMKRGG